MSESVGELQGWLDDQGLAWRELRKPEFLKFFARWREAFEPLFATGRPAATDADAARVLRERLPADAMLFWIRGYRYTPSDSAHPFYALEVEDLSLVDQDLFNRHETVVTDLDLSFCCMFTHEAGSLAEIQFWQREDS